MAAGLYEEVFTAVVSLINRYGHIYLHRPVSSTWHLCKGTAAVREDCLCSVIRALSSEQLVLASVMVVDTPGLRNPRHSGEERGADWSELCHNYLQERLLEHYHSHTFTHSLERYREVGLHMTFLKVHNESNRKPETMQGSDYSVLNTVWDKK